jgi:hypothetical protein
VIEEAEVRAVFRRIVDEGGDIVDLGDIAQARGWGGRNCIPTARVLRDEFGVSIKEALVFAAWIENDTVPGAADRERFRSEMVTPLR